MLFCELWDFGTAIPISVARVNRPRMNVPARFDHPAWTAAVATAASYGLGLLGLFVALFLVPFAAFLAL